MEELNLAKLNSGCRTLLSKATRQLTAEVKQDPFSTVRLGKLRALRADVKLAVRQLQEEASVFAAAADLSDLCWKRLNTLVTDIGEASRKLTIILGSGSRRSQRRFKDDLQVLAHLNSYFSFGISKILDLEDLIQVLSVQKKGCRKQVESVVSVASAGCFGQGPTAADSMKKLAEHFSALARKCMEIYRERAVDRKKEKANERLALVEDVNRRLVPLLRSHVLRFGLHLVDVSQGQHAITKLFDRSALEEAHHELEFCLTRLREEMALRRVAGGTPASRKSDTNNRRVPLKHRLAMKRRNSCMTRPSSRCGIKK